MVQQVVLMPRPATHGNEDDTGNDGHHNVELVVPARNGRVDQLGER